MQQDVRLTDSCLGILPFSNPDLESTPDDSMDASNTNLHRLPPVYGLMHLDWPALSPFDETQREVIAWSYV
jgi:hypothetical protein